MIHSFGPGVFPDCAIDDTGRGFLIMREGDPRDAGHVVVYGWTGVSDHLQNLHERARYDVPAGSPAFAKAYIYDGLDWIAYHDGTKGHLVCLSNGRREVLEPCENNEPIVFGVGHVAWQGSADDGWPITAIHLASGLVEPVVGFGQGTGLAYVTYGTVPLVIRNDDNRMSVPGLVNPVRAGSLTVGEDPDPANTNNLGVKWKFGDSIFRSLWADQPSLTPRAAAAGAFYAVTTWGQGADVRLFVGTLSDLITASSQPSPVPVPPPTPEPQPMPDIPDQSATVARVRAQYPTPLGRTHADCLIAIATAIGRGAGLLRKDSGTNIQLPDGTRVSQDIICFPDGHHFDCLGDAEGAARPDWQDKGIVEPERYYAVTSAPGPDPDPEPEPEPEPIPGGVTLAMLLAEIKRLQNHLGVR